MLLNGPATLAPLAVGTTPVTLNSGITQGTFRAFAVTPTNGTVYWGDSTVTTTNGQPLTAGSTWSLATRSPENFWLVAASGTVDVRVTFFTGVG